uniref:Uncharacterized protein n=1 Tax=Arundo donax TaxID=35708 RepID=A0A0A9GGF5_ARUDO
MPLLIQQLRQHGICTLGAVIVYAGDYVLRSYEPDKFLEFREAAVFTVRHFISDD